MTQQQIKSGDVVHADASGRRVRFYGAADSRMNRDHFYAYTQRSVRIGPRDGYTTLQAAIDGISRNDPREA